MNKNIKKMVFDKKDRSVVINDKYLIDTQCGALYWYEDTENNNYDFPQWVFDVRDDLRDIGIVK
mgnify:CR=1 FL=1